MNNPKALFLVFSASLILLFVLICLAVAVGPAEGAAEPTPTAPLPTCSDAGVDCFTPTPDDHWIDPEPWPTYSPPDAYPAPDPTPEPSGYPDYHTAPSIPFEETSKKGYVAESGSLADSLWAWVLDLFTH